MIHETLDEMHLELVEKSALKTFTVGYKRKKDGKDSSIKVKARNKDEALAAARQKLKGKYHDIHFARELDEITTTGDVAGYDAPMKLTDLLDDEEE